MQQNKTHRRILFVAQAAVIAALYTGITLATMATPIPWISYGPIQFRIAEALAMLAVLTPAAIPGLAIGCFFANLGSPYGIIDVVFGTLASLFAAICSYMLRKIEWKRLPWLSGLPPVLFNAVAVSAVIIHATQSPWAVFPLFAAQVGLGQLVVVYGLGMPLVAALRKTKIFREQR